jgi:hypothetical protein
MSTAATPDTESAAAKWLRQPLVIALAIIGTVAGAFRIAGVGSMFIADLLLFAGVGLLIPIEVGCSKWIRKTGRYWWLIVLFAMLMSGAATIFLVKTIASLKRQATVIPAPAPLPVPPTPNSAPAPSPSGPVLRLVRYESLPYRVGEPLKVRMFLNNSGSSSITLFGGTHSAFVDQVPDDYGERVQLEKRLWAGTEKYNSAKDRPLKFQTTITFADLASEEVLSRERIDQLGKGSVMYMMSIFKDATGKAMITSCFHTDPAGGNLFFCQDHNTP